MSSTNNFLRETPRQNQLAESLARVCRDHMLDEKWLVAPSRRIGQQWLETVARAGQPIINLRLHTIASLALDLAGPALAADGRQFLSSLGRIVLVARLLRELPKDNGYLVKLPPSLTLAERLAASLRDLRLAGLQPADLNPRNFEVATKGNEVIGLLRTYQRTLDEQRLLDDADLLRLALAASPPQVIVLAPADLELAALERRLLDATKPIMLPVDEPPASPTLDAFRAIGEANEVREVLRRCLANGWPLDQVELLHTDGATYVPLVYEIAEQLRVPVTFANGIPVRYSRPGRALAAWLAWIENDFPQSALVSMVQDGLLDGFDREFAGAFRIVPIGFGSDRYVRKLDEESAALNRQLAEFSTDEGGEARLRRRLQHRRDAINKLREPIEKLLAVSRTSLATATEFLHHHTRCANELDNYARDVLLERIAELQQCGGDDLDAREFLQAMLRDTRVLGLGPRPGSLHVANIDAGGHSGRPYTFIVGLDADRFPAVHGQDPVLLDNERTVLSTHLTTTAIAREQSEGGFKRLLGRLRGSVTMSYSSRSVARDMELFPSSVIPAVATTAALAPRRAEESLSESEWWLWRLCAAGPVGEASTLVGEGFPWLGRGLRAAEQRASNEFTAYDGFVPEAAPDLDPSVAADRQFSPRRLETIGTCPLRYFFQYALGLEPLEELEIDPHRWLPPAEFGQLLHEVFHRHLRDDVPLEKVLAERIAHYREKFPPPNAGVFRRDCRRLERAIRIFATEELKGRPIDFELEISDVPVALTDGTTIHVRGRIDRVDKLDGGALALFDYKTGSTFRYRAPRDDPFNGGRILQHAIYIELAKAHYGKPVAQFNYFFPTEKGRGESFTFTPAQLADAPAVLARLRQLIAHGSFRATANADDCHYCDYKSICRDVETITAQSQRKQ